MYVWPHVIVYGNMCVSAFALALMCVCVHHNIYKTYYVHYVYDMWPYTYNVKKKQN